MVFKFVLLVALIGCVRSSVVPLHAAPLQEAVKSEYDHHPQYAYAYDVQDTNTGDFKSQHEVRSGDVVKGSYSVVDPDGTKRTVDYTADDINGFNAVVSKEPITNSASPVITPVVAKLDAPSLITGVETPVVTKLETPAISPVKYLSVPNVQEPVKYITAPYNVEAPINYVSSPYNVAAPVKYVSSPYDVAPPVKYISSPYNLPYSSPVKYVAESFPQTISLAKYVSAPGLSAVKYIPNSFPNPVAVAKLETQVKYVADPYAQVAPLKYVSADSFDKYGQIAYATYSNPIVSASPYTYSSPYLAAYKNAQLSYATTDSYNGPIVSKVSAAPLAYAKYDVPQYYQTPVIAKYSSPYNELW